MEQLVKQRGILKGKVTNFTKFLDEIQVKIDAKETLDNITLVVLQKRLNDIENVLTRFEEIQVEIDSETNAEINAAERSEFENKYYIAISRAECILSSNISGNVGIARPQSPASSIISSASNSAQAQNSIKLPTIQLPVFSGISDQWLEFRDLFISLIDNNDQLDDIQRFHYLRASLGGDAAQIIKAVDFCGENYALAWDLLKERYNSTKVLIHNHVKSLFNLDSVNKESSSKLRHMLDTVSKHIRSIKGLTTPEALGETLTIYLVTSKLDQVTLREWEQTIKNEDLPTFENLKAFLKDRADLLETLESKQNKHDNDRSKAVKSLVMTNQSNCAFCKGSHAIWTCSEFQKLAPSERHERVRDLKLCILCLKKGHYIGNCNSKYCCSICKKRHNILLHKDVDITPTQSINAFSCNMTQVILPTASVKVVAANGRIHSARVLLDSGSQSNFVSDNLCRKLGLKTDETDITVLGITHSSSKVQLKCKLDIFSHYNDFKLNVSCLVVPKITSSLPGYNIEVDKLKIPKGYKLADQSFSRSAPIDLLLGANHFWELLCIGQINLGPNLPILQKSRLGWLVSGPISSNFIKQTSCNFSQTENIQQQLARFWEIEQNIETSRSLSMEEKSCEDYYVRTLARNEQGRFIVSLPLKESIENLGESRDQAEKRFLAVERKLAKNKVMRERYINFMDEYIKLDHMSEISQNENGISYYLPHHGVLKEDSCTTKLRVVFDGSAKTTSGYSLNDLQMTGPTIQSDLFSILIRFRQGYYALSADIEKMYRMVLVKENERSLQRILWRSNPNLPIKEYNLNTVTYGTAAGPFLAIRSLFQVSIDIQESEPYLSNIIKRNFYVDDLLISIDNFEEAKNICERLPQVLANGCFLLRKWISNDPNILENIDDCDKHPNLLNLGSHENTKTLGLYWNNTTDNLMYSIQKSDSYVITKRTILSEVSQIFDPLGLLSAITIIPKILLQDLWREKLEWDETLPSALHSKWHQFRDQLPLLNKLTIPRYVMCSGPQNIEIHAFCDASIKAYGSCLFIRSNNENGEVSVNLLCAKSKVAPVKQQTLPRLELLGALTAAKLVHKVRKELDIKIESCTFWCDSTIVLGWLKMPTNKLKTFVSNRVTEILEKSETAVWRHVPTDTNPADLLSRGVAPSDLLNSGIWWHGPTWLSRDPSSWPILTNGDSVVPELKREVQVLVGINKNNNQENFVFDFNRYSDLNKLERIVAYCLRFKYNASKANIKKRVGPLMPEEFNSALICLIKRAQYESFSVDLHALSQRKSLSSNSSILSLNPFLDSTGLIRVGGRLGNSNFNFNKCHPIVLSGRHRLTKLIFEREHIRLLHASPQQLLASIREKFWPTSGRNIARQTFHKCIKCYRVCPKAINPIMGNLPIARTEPAMPFETVGVDFAGPISIKDRKGRGCKISKCYICIYVCFVTKAVHLELVSSLSTESFLLSLRRFASRRGKPSHIYSDNGTNFMGAKSELDELAKFLVSEESDIVKSCSNEGINWHFIPPRSPHFGGLWESGIRSCKTHLKRVIGNTILTFEEMYSLLVQIEAILNSRPLSPLSSNPTDLNPLTPAHFLVGKVISSVPDPNVLKIPESRLSIYQKIQQLNQHYWRRWSKEYISELQQRTKWQKQQGNIQEGALVLIKEDNLPPLRWKLGRIIEVHPGQDGVNRVATIKTSSGNIRRAFSKICPLPTDE